MHVLLRLPQASPWLLMHALTSTHVCTRTPGLLWHAYCFTQSPAVATCAWHALYGPCCLPDVLHSDALQAGCFADHGTCPSILHPVQGHLGIRWVLCGPCHLSINLSSSSGASWDFGNKHCESHCAVPCSIVLAAWHGISRWCKMWCTTESHCIYHTISYTVSDEP